MDVFLQVSQAQGPMKATENFHKNDRTPTSNFQKRSVGSKQELTPAQTLDIELATALKVFFRDVNDVKSKVEGIKALGKSLRHHVTSRMFHHYQTKRSHFKIRNKALLAGFPPKCYPRFQYACTLANSNNE